MVAAELRPGSAFLAADAVARMTGGRLLAGSGVARAVSTDSRTLREGDLFLALEGARFDGHDFLVDAVRAGAAGLVVRRAEGTWFDRLPPGVFCVRVRDTGKAYLDLAAAWRRACPARVVAVSGSCGKTTTKDFLAALCTPLAALVVAEKSFNNRVGVPKTIFRLDARSELCILELGTNRRGEIAELAAAAAPDVAVLTMIGRGHLEGLGDLEGVLEEKAALLDALSEDGICVLPADDPRAEKLAARAGSRRILRFGLRSGADLRALDPRPREGGMVVTILDRTEGDESRVPIEVPLPGAHNLRNLCAALAAGRGLGFPLESLLAEVPRLRGPSRRLERKSGWRGATLLDDSYNANPESLQAALAVLDTWPGARRRFLLLGDMAELGEAGPALHEELGTSLGGRIDGLFSLGPLASVAASAFRKADPGSLVRSFDRAEECLAFLRDLLGSGDVLLIKGSRVMALDRIADALIPGAEDRGAPPFSCSTSSSSI